MSASAAIADPLLRRAFGQRARPSDPHRTVGDWRPSFWRLSPSEERDRHRHRRRSQSPGLCAPVSRRGSAISRRTVINMRVNGPESLRNDSQPLSSSPTVTIPTRLRKNSVGTLDSRARHARLAGKARRVDLVHLVCFVHLVSLVQPNKPNKPNKQEKQAGSRTSRATVSWQGR